MSHDFSVSTELISGELRIKARGEFDRKAARVLLELLRDHESGQERVVIDTRELWRVHTLACTLFREGMHQCRRIGPRLMFIGSKGRAMAGRREAVMHGEYGDGSHA
ncbi:STAS domain-containing protein [Desulfonatronum thiodismutans]|uniref:STAS domain-containing protein n=1 Tax=Desulfonatronum thiodismutans TaxID=159290 RepID=UPI0004ABD6A6|nr:STAS domain-containing protein [Desulfonatronum thiodismutans]